VQEFHGDVRFVGENYGESALARRYGVTRYPAIFVDDVLVATPKDFGFYGQGEGSEGGRYAPFVRNAANQERFRRDLARVIQLVLAGRGDEARASAVPVESTAVASFPSADLADIDGRAVSRADLAGHPVIVEFWATWCPPCRGTLAWLGEVKKQYGDQVVVVTIAVESELADVRKLAESLGHPFRWVMGTAAVGQAFGDVSAVPTLLVFGGDGRTAGAFYGATPSLHADVGAVLRAQLGK
jgi:thiol-disulfide isomerase/thioredoxin